MVNDSHGSSWLTAAWEAPNRIKAGITTRLGGFSGVPYNKLNLATHVGDDAAIVTQNREYVSSLLKLRSEPLWLNQVHGNRIVCTETDTCTADGACTDKPDVVCTVMTADCVPVLLCNAEGTRVAAVHVGWKGFCASILDNALKLFRNELPGIHVWVGPHIRSQNYEVGNDVRDSCLVKDKAFSPAFTPNSRGRWQADLEWMIRHDLEKYGIHRISSSGYCTYAEPELFYSYRRDGQTGRMASMIWIESTN